MIVRRETWIGKESETAIDDDCPQYKDDITTC